MNRSKILKQFNLLLVLFSMAVIGCSSPAADITVMSLNIRYDNPNDKPNTWANRRELVAATIRSENVLLLGVQEALVHQVSDLKEKLTGYAYYGAGRDDGRNSGEFAPIFYRTDRFEKLDEGTFWLSENPDSAGSIGWDAHFPRIVSWLKLQDKSDKQNFFIFNTHLSHISDTARENSVILIRKKITGIAGNMPVIVCGDFNFNHKSKAYEIITGPLAGETELFNTRAKSSTQPAGLDYSFNGFGRIQPGIIDYIFVSKPVVVHNHQVMEVKTDSIFISDHYPVKADISF